MDAAHPDGRASRPAFVSDEDARRFLYSVANKGASWSWIAFNITVLRTAFDKLCGLRVTAGFRTPKRPQPLRDILAPEEARRLLAAARSARDRLALGLLYGCGLKVGELCALRVGDADPDTRALTVTSAGGTRQRTLSIPENLLPLLRAEMSFREAGDFLLRGRTPGAPLSARTIQRLVRSAAQLAGLPKEVTPMTLRHSHAVTRLREGENIRVLQEDLGHRLVETTLAYSRYILPPDLVSPADRLSILPRAPQPMRSAFAALCHGGGP